MDNAGWVDMRQAIAQAKEMVTTVIVTLFLNRKEPITFVVEVKGVDEMYVVLQKLNELKKKTTIKSFNVHNLGQMPAVDVEGLLKALKVLGK